MDASREEVCEKIRQLEAEGASGEAVEAAIGMVMNQGSAQERENLRRFYTAQAAPPLRRLFSEILEGGSPAQQAAWARISAELGTDGAGLSLGGGGADGRGEVGMVYVDEVGAGYSLAAVDGKIQRAGERHVPPPRRPAWAAAAKRACSQVITNCRIFAERFCQQMNLHIREIEKTDVEPVTVVIDRENLTISLSTGTRRAGLLFCSMAEAAAISAAAAAPPSARAAAASPPR